VSVPSFARARLSALLGVTAVLVLALISTGIDARARSVTGRAQQAHAARIVRATGLSELALSTSSTWLRHPSLAAPSAAVSDAPLGLDVDPAGATIARPTRERAIEMEAVP
jgi:hypothetical protein